MAWLRLNLICLNVGYALLVVVAESSPCVYFFVQSVLTAQKVRSLMLLVNNYK